MATGKTKFSNYETITLVLAILTIVVTIIGFFISGHDWFPAPLPQTETSVAISTSSNSDNVTATSNLCEGYNSRVQIGAKVITANALDQSLNIRKLPSLSSPIVNSLQNNAELQILDGPICSDKIMWWEASTTDGKVKGWVAEVSLSGVYYLRPE
ncbi:MAG TPA: SH3 domain-containing protein [Anaerolineales bacterium]|nr:SH3 domain-containing protein [Anaerolineales bacterium]